jgi:hypothetical protein
VSRFSGCSKKKVTFLYQIGKIAGWKFDEGQAELA